MARETGRATHESGRLPEIPDPDVHLNRGVRRLDAAQRRAHFRRRFMDRACERAR